MNTIGVVLSHRFTTLRTDHYVSGLLDGIMSVLSAHDQDTMIFTGQGTSGGRPSLSVVGDGRCDGLILFSSDLNASLPTALREAGIPFTLINRLGTEVDVSSVTVDNASAMCQLVQHVIEQGHRRIAFLGGANTESAYERLAGYRQALEAAQIAYEPEWVTLESYERVSGHRRALQMLSLPRSHRPTALCCGSDMVALGAIEGLREAGLRVPEDVSVTGFDDMPEAATSVPALTTVHLPVAAIGTRAAEMLWEQISRESSDLRQEVLPTRLVLRASVAPPAETAV
jgi:LacI family transcriptional regulator